MMQQWSAEEHAPNGLGISQMQQAQDQGIHGLPFANDMSATDQLQTFAFPQQAQDDPFDSPMEFNRRTLTQEQFDAFGRDGGIMNGSGQFMSMQAGFSGDQHAMHEVFPNYQPKQDVTAFDYALGASLPSNDSPVPPNTSNLPFHVFPSSNGMQSHPSVSATSSDWTDSRSSSLSAPQYDNNVAHISGHQQPPPVTTSRWEPGKSVPVDLNVMKGEFEQVAAQARAYEQPLAWPADEAFVPRESSASLLAQSMGNVGINTPQTNQMGVFKSPAPPADIAARRQRPRPAALGIASLRSQSFGGPVQPGSPGHGQQHHGMPQGQSIRRVMSNNVLNGGVAQGRIMKSVPGSAQRSPLNWNFTDAINSPHLVRHVSHNNLAPPTPMSPSAPEQSRQYSTWQNSSGHVSRQPSISETELEHGLPYQPSASVPPPHVSPPHTPMWWQQQFVPQRIGSTVITENTPPQSAPASQSCFPSNIFTTPHQHVQQQGPPPQLSFPQQMHAMLAPQQQSYVNPLVPDQHFQMPNVTFAPNQQADVVVSGPPPGVPLHFANGVPVVNADGNIQMAFPTQAQLMHQQQQQPQQTPSPPQMSYAFVTSADGSPGTQATAHPPKQANQPASDFIVHEYTPPDSIKRSATPRKTVDTGPKNYTFSNAGPEFYEEKKAKKGDSKESTASSNSPASSIGATSTS